MDPMNLAEIAERVGEEEAVKIAVDQFGMDEVDARFMLRIERGEIQGDVVGIGNDGKPIDPAIGKEGGPR
jgi:hypothetical protein